MLERVAKGSSRANLLQVLRRGLSKEESIEL